MRDENTPSNKKGKLVTGINTVIAFVVAMSHRQRQYTQIFQKVRGTAMGMIITTTMCMNTLVHDAIVAVGGVGVSYKIKHFPRVDTKVGGKAIQANSYVIKC